MRRVLLLLAFVLVPVLAGAQSLGGEYIRYYPPAGSGGAWDGGAFSSAALGPTGCTDPAYSFGDQTAAGVCRNGANDIHFRNSANDYLQITNNQLTARIGGTQYFALTANGLTVGSTSGTADWFVLTPQTGGAAGRYFEQTTADVSANRTVTWPDVSGTPQVNLVAGTAAPGATECDAANEVGRLYHQTGDPATVNLQLFRCTQTGPASYAWHPVAYQLGTTAPATCTVGAVFFDSDATAGSNWFGCTSANTWTVLGGGMGDPGANGIMVRTAANTSTNRTLQAGTGVTVSNGSGVAGDPTVAADQAVVVFKGSGTDDPPAACGDTGDAFQLLDFYLETDTNEIYQCRAVDTWVLTAHVADDSVLVGSGTGLVVEAIPDCDDTGGNHLNYNTTGSAGSRFSCGTSGGSGGLTITSLTLTDEFPYGNGTQGAMGEIGWLTDNIGSGGSASNTSSETGHPGVLQIAGDGANDNSGRYIAALGITNADIVGEDWDFNLIFKLEDAVTDTYISAGLTATTDLTQTNAIRMVYDTDVSHTQFQYQICDSSTSGCQSAGDDTNADVVASGVNATINTWYTLTIQRRTSGVGGNPTYYFNITGGAQKTFCSSGCDEDLGNLPSADPMYITIMVAQRSATLKRKRLDFFDFRMTGLGR